MVEVAGKGEGEGRAATEEEETAEEEEGEPPEAKGVVEDEEGRHYKSCLHRPAPQPPQPYLTR